MLSPELSIVLFQGRGVVSSLIKYVSNRENGSIVKDVGTFSHVGVLVSNRIMDIPNSKDGEYYVLEITCSGAIAQDYTMDLMTDSYKLGLQVRSFKKLQENYSGRIFLLPLAQNPTERKEESIEFFEERIQKIKKTINSFYLKNTKTKYQLNPLMLLSSAIPYLRRFRKYNIISSNWKQCAQITSELYKELGLLKKTVETDNVIPEDFIKDIDNQIPKDFGIFPLIAMGGEYRNIDYGARRKKNWKYQ